MFTGIVTDQGIIAHIIPGPVTRVIVKTHYDTTTIALGASIAHNGICLTVVEIMPDAYAVELSPETLSKTTAKEWQIGQKLNLERALRLGDELGGHVVSGHVDGTASIIDIAADGDCKRLFFKAPESLAKFIAPKGSVTLDGVSLTVNEVDGECFGVSIIPHTQSVTTFGFYRIGDIVNLEIDMLARYVARLLA